MIVRMDHCAVWLTTGKKITFPYVVRAISMMGTDQLLVILEPPHNRGIRDQVFLVDVQGNIVWQIRKSDTLSGYFTGIIRADSDLIEVYDYAGVKVDVDPATGEILREEFVR
jgi:hypothetical protein